MKRQTKIEYNNGELSKQNRQKEEYNQNIKVIIRVRPILSFELGKEVVIAVGSNVKLIS
jgi:hypothetical protein